MVKDEGKTTGVKPWHRHGSNLSFSCVCLSGLSGLSLHEKTQRFYTRATVFKHDFDEFIRSPKLRRRVNPPLHLVRVYTTYSSYFVNIMKVNNHMALRDSTMKQQRVPKMSKVSKQSISLVRPSDIPQHTVRYQVTSPANKQLSHFVLVTAREEVYMMMASVLIQIYRSKVVLPISQPS